LPLLPGSYDLPISKATLTCWQLVGHKLIPETFKTFSMPNYKIVNSTVLFPGRINAIAARKRTVAIHADHLPGKLTALNFFSDFD
jgi:hypothetical protein